jgi:hypothetical protein
VDWETGESTIQAKARHDQIQRRDRTFDKTKEDTRADAFKTNAGLGAVTTEPRLIVRRRRP